MIKAQPYFPVEGHVFNDSIIPRVDILMDPDSLAVMYDDLYTDHEYPATFIFNNGTATDTLENTGIRIRGNTSQTSQKKSFKIDFNEFVPGRKFYGLEKLHLNGEHNDPCITRSRLYWDILESMNVPGSRANHVDLFINGIFFGLYVNVEVVDENFLYSRFGNNYGNLYKCLYPADLHFINSNPESYKLIVNDRRVYELETNQDDDDYSDLSTFISMLHFTADTDFVNELEKQFNVNSFLRAYALDVASGNWDDYAYNINNYYLYYNPEKGKFEYIVYDTDNTLTGLAWIGEQKIFTPGIMEVWIRFWLCVFSQFLSMFPGLPFLLSSYSQDSSTPSMFFPRLIRSLP
jgi:spore coat protein CotH